MMCQTPAPMPLLLEATFIPFRDVIISDGIVMPYTIVIGKNMAKQFKDIYMDAKKNGRIIRSKAAMENSAIEEKKVENDKWKKFGKLTDKCYSNMIGAEKDGSCWKQAFELLKEIILEERQENPNYAAQLKMIDDITDYVYDIQGWLEDCIDEIDMREEYEELLKMCDDLLELFDWPGYTGSEIKFRKSSSLGELGRRDEAAKYCAEWIKKEPENIAAATAGVYAFTDTKEFNEAEKLVDRFIPDKSECTDENDIMFTAASKLYGAMGRRKEKRQIDKAIEKYEEYLEEYFLDFDMEDDEFSFD